MVPKKEIFAPKNTFWFQNRIFALFAILGSKVHFWRKKWFLGQKCDFEQKVHFGDLTNSHTGSQICDLATMAPKKVIFAPKITFWLQNRIFAPFVILGPKVHFLRKSALSRPHAADAYKPNGILIKMEPFLAQRRFWAKKCILGSEIHFGAQSEKNDPEVHFSAQKCTFRKSDQKVNDGLSV